MKHIIFKSAVAVLVSAVTFISCNNEDKFVSDVSNQNAEVETLIKELQSLNEETLAEYGKTIDFTTRATIPVNKDTPELEQAKMKWWKRLLSVIAADAVGAACGNHFAGPAGGVIVGAGASLLMYWATGCGSAINNQGIGNDFSQDDLSAYTIVMDSIFYNMNNDITDFDKIGDCHNTIVLEILKNQDYYVNADGSLNEDILIQKIKSTAQTMGYNTTSINTARIKNELNRISDARAACVDSTFEVQIESYATLLPDKKNEISILKDYINTAASLPNVEAVKKYSAAFENKLYYSQVTGLDKKMIFAAESVAKNSAVGWTVASTYKP